MSKVTSIIVDYNSLDFTIRAIKSLLKYDGELIDKIIVVDNFGISDYSPLFRISNKVMVIKPYQNLGFGRAINLAINYVTTPFVLLQNPDTVCHKKTLLTLINAINKDNAIAAVTITAKTPEGQEILARRFTKPHDIIAGRRSPLLKLRPIKKIGEQYRYMDKLNEKKPFFVDAFTGTFVLIKKHAFLKAQGFDSQYFLFMEDIDLSRKLKELGFKILLVPDLHIIHYVGSTRKKSPLKSGYTKAKSVYLYFKKWNELDKSTQPFVGLLLGLYTIFTLFLNLLDIQRPELSWKTLLKRKH